MTIENNSTTSKDGFARSTPSADEIIQTCKQMDNQMKQLRYDLLTAIMATGLVKVSPSHILGDHQIVLLVSEKLYGEIN